MGRALLLAVCLLLAAPAAASAHAILQESTPESGAGVDAAPESVALRFNELIEASFGAVRVFDTDGGRVDDGGAFRPGGRSAEIAVPLRPDLPDGTYTVTYRVVSADSHPVSSGFVFSVGTGGASPEDSVGELLAESDAGPVTGAAFGVARGLDYAAIALMVGAGVFLLIVWLPALRSVAGAGGEWRAASERFAGRLRKTVVLAAAVGIAGGVAGIVLQGATAAGTSAWAALDPQVMGDVLATRFGTVWGLRVAAFAMLGVAAYVALALRRGVALRPAPLGATGLVLDRPPWAAVLLASIPLAFLAVSPALAGHASTQDPTLVLFPANVVHVVAMSAWVGGLALLLAVVPAATRRLSANDRTRLLAALLLRFSPLALAAVAVLLATGILQSVIHLESPADLIDTAFGRAVLIKFLLLLVLVGIGAFHRRRTVPPLRRLADAGESPARPGILLRRALRAEVALVAVVLGVTAALVSYTPPDALSAGPFSTASDLGTARLEVTVDPAQVGSNEMHLYFFDADDGTQYDDVKAVDVSFSLPAKDVGPLEMEAERAGPGHFIVPDAALGLEGEWQADVLARVSKFEALDTELEVPVE